MDIKQASSNLLKVLANKYKDTDLGAWLQDINKAFNVWKRSEDTPETFSRYKAERMNIRNAVWCINKWVGCLQGFDIKKGRKCAVLSEDAGEYMYADGINPWDYKEYMQQVGFVMTKEKYYDILNRKCLVLLSAATRIK